MKINILILGLVLVFTWSVDGQRLPPSSSNRDTSRTPEGSAAAARALTQLRHLETKRTKINEEEADAKVAELYRKHTKEEAAALAPSRELLEEYARFLGQPNTGMIKLNSDDRCGQDKNVISAAANCSDYLMPGGGSAYSFRFNSYRIPRLSDIMLKKDILLTDGIGQQGVLVDLGDMPIESLSAESKELSFLSKFKPAKSRLELDRSNRELEVGVNDGGRLHRLAFYASPNHTYGLRSIAFQGSVKRTSGGIVYDEFKFDKRLDVMVVFRVVGKDAKGNLTIIWKELSRAEAPKFPM